jgi:hypothetical protein
MKISSVGREKFSLSKKKKYVAYTGRVEDHKTMMMMIVVWK